jgi:pectin methylesterase-like acyl-CoA thioesterase
MNEGYMSLNKQIVLSVAIAAVLSACSATPDRNETLEQAAPGAGSATVTRPARASATAR